MLARKVGTVGYTAPPAKPMGRSRLQSGWFTRPIKRIIGATLLISFFFALCVSISVWKTNYGYDLTARKQHVQQLQRENDMLRVDLADLETPGRVYTLATQQLGMILPTQTLYSSSRYEAASGGKSR